MKPKHYKIIISSLLILMLLVSIDTIVGVVGRKMISRCNKTSFYGEINYAITEATPEILILGASTAKSDIVPNILIDSFGLSVYNAGSDGKNLMYHTCVGNSVLKRKKTKVVLLVVHPYELQTGKKERMSVLNPFYDYDSLIKESVNWESSTEFIKMKSNLYRYNSRIFTILENSLKGEDNTKSLGFRALPVTNSRIERDTIRDKEGIDTTSINRLKWFASKCSDDEVELIVIISPQYCFVAETPQSISIIRKVCEEKNIPLLNYLQDEAFVNHPELFKDATHLNINGAEIFTKMMVKDIRKYWQVNNDKKIKRCFIKNSL